MTLCWWRTFGDTGGIEPVGELTNQGATTNAVTIANHGGRTRVLALENTSLGLELGLFTKLGSNSMTGRELQEALGLSARANPDFFDALVALRFLERDGDGPDARYRNMPETAVFLDRNDPGYIGGILEKKMQLIQAVYDALPAGGAFVVIENLIDDARRENVFGLMMSLNMLIEFGDAFDFTAAVAYK